MHEKIIILDFGSQYTQLIARRVRELNVYCEVIPFNKVPKIDQSIKGIILSGSPFSVLDKNALQVDLDKIIGKVPVLGICYGAQYIANYFGGKVEKSDKREYGRAEIEVIASNDVFLKDISTESQVWMSHGDTIASIPDGFEVIAKTKNIPVAIYHSKPDHFAKPVYCIQFHPEVTHTIEGKQFLENFVLGIAECKTDWTPATFVEETVANLKKKIGNDHVLLGLSGGVDSSVAAILLHKAIGKNLFCFFIDNGLLRKNEFQEVLDSYQGMGLNIKGIDAKVEFWDALKGLTDPELKRKAIGRVFIEVFEKEAKKLPQIKWLAQGTIYPDIIESVSVHGPSVTIKSHHNVGGLPEKLALKIVEPLSALFKDEVRRVGASMNMSEHLLGRHPFPGPGLGIRILGDVTPEKVQLLQDADAIFIENLKKFGYYDKVWQAGAMLLPVRTVGVMGDERTYEKTLALRCVNSEDGMTAVWSDLPYKLLATVSNEIINNVKGINRVVYDISTKPPSTIEWE